MATYLTGKDAIYALHKRGYVYDFQLMGNDLMLVQEKQFVRAGDFVITACYKFNSRKQKGKGLVIFGVVALYTNVRGILIKHYQEDNFKVAPVMIKNYRK